MVPRRRPLEALLKPRRSKVRKVRENSKPLYASLR